MRAANRQPPEMQLFSYSFLDLSHAKEEDLRLPLPLFVLLDVFRSDCMSQIDCTNFHTYSDWLVQRNVSVLGWLILFNGLCASAGTSAKGYLTQRQQLFSKLRFVSQNAVCHLRDHPGNGYNSHSLSSPLQNTVVSTAKCWRTADCHPGVLD